MLTGVPKLLGAPFDSLSKTDICSGNSALPTPANASIKRTYSGGMKRVEASQMSAYAWLVAAPTVCTISIEVVSIAARITGCTRSPRTAGCIARLTPIVYLQAACNAPRSVRPDDSKNVRMRYPHPKMMQFMQQVRANLAQQDQGDNEGPSDWSEPANYNCLTPVSNSFAQEIRQSLQKLTGQPGFPPPYPVVLKQSDLAKLSKFDYQAMVCRGELRMALCFLQVGDRKTVTVLVSENMMVVRVRMNKVPYG